MEIFQLCVGSLVALLEGFLLIRLFCSSKYLFIDLDLHNLFDRPSSPRFFFDWRPLPSFRRRRCKFVAADADGSWLGLSPRCSVDIYGVFRTDCSASTFMKKLKIKKRLDITPTVATYNIK